MGTRGYEAYRYKGKYYRHYIRCNAYPEDSGCSSLDSIPRNPKSLEKWIQAMSKKLLHEEARGDYDSDDDIRTDSDWTLCMGDVRWTYVIDLDNRVFTVNGILHFKFNNLPPLKRSGSKLGFVDYFSESYEAPYPEIPAEYLASPPLDFWSEMTFDAERGKQEYPALQLTLAALSEWNAPTWDTLSAAQHLSINLIKTLVYDYSDELALCWYSGIWTKLGVFCWKVANAAATSHLICPPTGTQPGRGIGYVLDVGHSRSFVMPRPHSTIHYCLEHEKIRSRFYWFRGCLVTFAPRLDEPVYMAHKVAQMVRKLRKNDSTEGVGIIMSGWHLIAVTVHGSDVRHSPVLDLHDGKEPKDGALLLMHLLSPTFTSLKAPWLTPLKLHSPSYSNRPNVPDEVLRQIIYFTGFESHIRLSEVSRYFRSIYLSEPRIGNYTLLSYEGVSLKSEPMFRVRRIDQTDAQLATLTRVKTSMHRSQKAVALRKYEQHFPRTTPIIKAGLGGMFQYHKTGIIYPELAPAEETKDSSTESTIAKSIESPNIGGRPVMNQKAVPDSTPSSLLSPAWSLSTMSPELPPTDYADAPDSEDVVDSLYGVNTQAPDQNWWESAVSASHCSVITSERDSLTQVSPLGKRCVITGRAGSVVLTHLIAKCTNAEQIKKYQFTFGHKLDMNSRWFCIYLFLDLHHLFDTRKCALIPTPAVITRIANKLRDEKARRAQLGIQGPWPDYRQAGWFPITKAGIDCHFILLGIHDAIFRHRNLDDPSAAPRDFRQFNPPSFEGFPTLRLSAHPYAMILNAAPKLEKYLKTRPLPFPADSSYEEIRFIYDTLKRPPEIPDTSSDGSTQLEQGPSHGSNAGTESGISDILSRLRPWNKSCNANQSTSSHQGSTQQDKYNNLVEAVSDGPANTSRNSCFSDTTPDHLNGRVFMDFKHQAVAKWITEVERACGQNVAVGPENHSSPDLERYAAEPARAPPTVDWHDCKSEFAPWWVLLPELEERGVLSSNDWVEIANLPPLTRKLDSKCDLY
ncbi:Bifunctional uridylyltransferase/uridylyl-removing enzyme [Rhizoctonia solani]|uniref:Bifunctional uridylyltransferase/uridylyl-removing enzyme n=1 Tax=Rhizoctonia solani TaxID=456999 RepID=A0A0K6G4R2_9AGAM|nr:Bifunctional uridylyltransferase/uridylyl-removing enzyme [Rhizoctonia solani]